MWANSDKTLIVLMVVGLVSGLNQVRTSPLWESDKRLLISGLVVGLAMNLLITTVSVKTVMRLKKILSGRVCSE
jgi:hypothetical protein